jgi:hypothetical protein
MPYFCFMTKLFTGVIAAMLLLSCGSSELTKAEDAQDAGRQFIRSCLDGDYEKARFFLMKDEDNLRLLEKWQRDYQQMSGQAKRSYREASIRPIAITSVSDTLTTYRYHHTSNTKDTFTLHVVKVNDEWLVDLKSIISPK